MNFEKQPLIRKQVQQAQNRQIVWKPKPELTRELRLQRTFS